MASHTNSMGHLETLQDTDIRKLNDLALATGCSSKDLVRHWKALRVKLKSYKLMEKLSEAAQRRMLDALATIGGYRTNFSRLNAAPWHLTLDELVATFGCSSLTSVTMLKSLSDLAKRSPETTSWENVHKALSVAQQERQKRGISVYETWTPADVAAAQLVLVPQLAAARDRPTPESSSSPASHMQSDTEALVALAEPSDPGPVSHTTTRKRSRSSALVSSIELARSTPPALDKVEEQTPTSKRSRLVHTLSTLPASAGSRVSSIVLQCRIGAAVLPVDNMEAHERPVDTPTAARVERQHQGAAGGATVGETQPPGVQNQDSDDNASPKESSSLRQDADMVSLDCTAVDGGAADEKSAFAHVADVSQKGVLVEHGVLGEERSLVAAQARRLMRNDESGRLSHSDFTAIINRILPPQFKCFELPDLDETTDWAAWAKRPLNRALDRELAYISVVHLSQQHHWIVLVTVPTEKVIDMYDSQGQTSELVASAAPHVVTRMGFNWEDGWRYRMRAAPKQDDAFSSGIHALVCAMYRIAGETRPTTIDVPLWRHVLSGLLVEREEPFNVSRHLEGLVSAMVASPSRCDDTKRALAAHAWIQNQVQSMSIIFRHLEKCLEQEQHDVKKAFEQARAAVRDLEHLTPMVLAFTEQANQGSSLYRAHVPYMQELERQNKQKKRCAMRRTVIAAKVKRVSYMVATLADVDMNACRIMWDSIHAATSTANDTLRILNEMEGHLERRCPSAPLEDPTM
jgi:hypothetical protein